jgi:hypothetical protein
METTAVEKNAADQFAAIGALQSLQDIAAELTRAQADVTAATQRISQLEADQVQADATGTEEDSQGIEAALLVAQRAKRRAEAKVDEITRRLRDAKVTERERARRERHARAVANTRAVAEEVKERYSALAGELTDLLKRMYDADCEACAVNKDLPDGCVGVPAVEAFRFTPATPDRVEEFTAREPVEAHFVPGQPARTQEVRRSRTIPGTPERRPENLYAAIELPGLKASDPPFRVPGTRRQPCWSWPGN